MTKVIGLTGGIGSGKTTVANLFLDFGVPVYITDLHARNVMQLQQVLDQIRIVFGNSVFEDGNLVRDKLSKIVFNDKKKLAQLNAIVHPAVRAHFQQWLIEHKGASHVIYESAILFEAGNDKNCDFIINVVAPIETRIERVLKRDNTTREKVLERIKNQWNDEQKSAKSDFILENISLEAVKMQIVKILKILGITQIKS